MDAVHVVINTPPPVTRQEESPQAGREPHPEPLLGCRQSFLLGGDFTQPQLDVPALLQGLQLIFVQEVAQLVLVGTGFHVQLAVSL